MFLTSNCVYMRACVHAHLYILHAYSFKSILIKLCLFFSFFFFSYLQSDLQVGKLQLMGLVSKYFCLQVDRLAERQHEQVGDKGHFFYLFRHSRYQGWQLLKVAMHLLAVAWLFAFPLMYHSAVVSFVVVRFSVVWSGQFANVHQARQA